MWLLPLHAAILLALGLQCAPTDGASIISITSYGAVPEDQAKYKVGVRTLPDPPGPRSLSPAGVRCRRKAVWHPGSGNGGGGACVCVCVRACVHVELV